MNYIKKMKDLRIDRDFTQNQIAQVLGTSQTMYARYERGANELPIRHLIKLCDFYGVSADFFSEENDQPAKTSKKFEVQLKTDSVTNRIRL